MRSERLDFAAEFLLNLPNLHVVTLMFYGYIAELPAANPA